MTFEFYHTVMRAHVFFVSAIFAFAITTTPAPSAVSTASTTFVVTISVTSAATTTTAAAALATSTSAVTGALFGGHFAFLFCLSFHRDGLGLDFLLTFGNLLLEQRTASFFESLLFLLEFLDLTVQVTREVGWAYSCQ